MRLTLHLVASTGIPKEPNFCMVDLPILPIEEQTAIAVFLEKKCVLIERIISVQEQQIEKLREYKTTLINSAVTGKIRVTPEMAAAVGSP